MTLIASFICRDYAIQVSDRRFVWLDSGGAVTRKNDQKNKSVVWCNRLAFAFTGIGNLGMERRTDKWLMAQIAEWETAKNDQAKGQHSLLAEIAARATAYFEGPRISRLPPSVKQHSFVGVGWARFSSGGKMEPYIARISNMAGATAQDSFAIGLTRLEGDADCRVEFDGQMIGETEEVNLQQISTLYPTSRDFTGQVAYILMQIIREVAARNDLVGRGLLITVMPRTSIKEGEASGLAAGVLMEGEQSFLYVPPDADKGIQYGPGCICHGVQVTDYKSGPPEAFSGLDGNPALDG